MSNDTEASISIVGSSSTCSSSSSSSSPPAALSFTLPPQSYSHARGILLPRPLKRLKQAFKTLFELGFNLYVDDQFVNKLILVKPSFSDNFKIPLHYFNAQIKRYINQRMETDSSCEFYVVRQETGKRETIRMLSQPFFYQDEKVEVSWGEFKDFFYWYNARYKLEIQALQSEIVVYDALRKLFRKFAKNPKNALTYEMLKKLVTKAQLFRPDNAFWQLECWQPEFAQRVTTESLFSEKYLPGKNSENLNKILEQLQVGLQPDLGDCNSLCELLIFSNAEILADIPTYELLKIPGMDTTSSHNIFVLDDNSSHQQRVALEEKLISIPASSSSTSLSSSTSFSSITSTTSSPSAKSSKEASVEPSKEASSEASKQPCIEVSKETSTETSKETSNEEISKVSSDLLRDIGTSTLHVTFSDDNKNEESKKEPPTTINKEKQQQQSSSSLSSWNNKDSSFNKSQPKLTELKELNPQAREKQQKILDFLNDVNDTKPWVERVERILDRVTSRLVSDCTVENFLDQLEQAAILVALEFDMEEDALKIQSEENERKHKTMTGFIKKKPLLDDEKFNEQKGVIEASLEALHREQEDLTQLFTRAIHQAVKQQASIFVKQDSVLASLCNSNLEKQPDTSRFISYSATLAPSFHCASFLDHSSQLQPVKNQLELQVTGASIAAKTIQEWIDYQQNGWISDLSAASLELNARSLVGGPAAVSADLVALALLQKGVISVLDWDEYTLLHPTQKIKSRVLLQARSARHMIDQIASVDNLQVMKQALTLDGPLLLTLPVYNPTLADKFWVSSEISATQRILGYQTVVIVGYNDMTSTVKIRTSFGMHWGDFGYTEMPQSQVFLDGHQVLALISTTSHFRRKQLLEADMKPMLMKKKKATSNKKKKTFPAFVNPSTSETEPESSTTTAETIQISLDIQDITISESQQVLSEETIIAAVPVAVPTKPLVPSETKKPLMNVAKQVVTSQDLWSQDDLQKAVSKAQYYKRQYEIVSDELAKLKQQQETANTNTDSTQTKTKKRKWYKNRDTFGNSS